MCTALPPGPSTTRTPAGTDQCVKPFLPSLQARGVSCAASGQARGQFCLLLEPSILELHQLSPSLGKGNWDVTHSFSTSKESFPPFQISLNSDAIF